MSAVRFRRLRRFFTDQRGGVSVMLVLMMIPMVGVMGMAVEGSSFYLTGRAMQNAADSAAIAAATNACDVAATCHTGGATQPTFVQEAAAVATNYGFTNGVNDTTVNTKTKACPDDNTKTCYWVKITRVTPVNMLRMIGFRGDAVLSSGLGRGQTVAAMSVSTSRGTPASLCITALATTGNGITTNGNGNAFSGCAVGTNATANCNHSQGAISTVATGGSTCGGPIVNQTIVDPYAGLKTNIPNVSGCGTPAKNAKPATIPAGTLALGPTPLIYCTGASLAGNVVTSGTGVIVVVNGNFDPNGNTFTTASAKTNPVVPASAVTIIFTNSNGSLASGMVEASSKGGIDIVAPSSGTWSGMAIYTNPDLTTTVTYKANGNTATTLAVEGAMYMPHASMTFDGSFNKATGSGNECIALVVNDFTGNGGLKTVNDCASAGLIPPNGGIAVRQALVR